MATIKSFTDIEQSKKLAEILPLESADMRYICIDICKGLKYMPEPRFIKDIPDHADEYDVCAWSLAALLGVLPEIDDTSLILEKVKAEDGYDGYYYHIEYKDKILIPYSKTPVDACVAMIIHLNELKLL